MQVMRAFAAAGQEFRKMGPKLWRIARELFHEVVGFVFLSMALYFTVGREGLVRTFQDLDSEPDSFPRLLLVGLFVALFAGFGISSFLRAKRISRER